MRYFKSVLFALALVYPATSFSQDGVDSRYIGVWKGNWLEGMSSGKATLNISESSGLLSFTALPSFGVEPAPLKSIKGSEKSLGFQAIGADGRVMRFDLKPSSEYKTLSSGVDADPILRCWRRL
jgi:hypothetical protein